MYDNSKDVARWFQDGGDIKRFQYKLNPSSVVVDLGGYRGEFANTIYKKFGCLVYVYEPIQGFYNQCVELNKNNPSVKVFPAAISGYDDGIQAISIEGDASSMFKVDGAANKVNIRVFPIDTLFTSVGLHLVKIDLLKINVEGAEFGIIDALITLKHVAKVTNIQVQFHNFVPDAEAKREALHRELLKTHHLTFNYPFVWENWELNNV